MKQFTLAPSEERAADQFEKDHDHPAHNNGSVGGGISYRFTPTGIGSAIVVICGTCKMEKNITDFENW